MMSGKNIKAVWALPAVVMIAVFAFNVAAEAKPPKPDGNPAGPNVLFISMDDLNDWVEPLGGHPQARTPNLSRLADQSVVFTRAYCASPGCNPSRTSIMTGLAPHTSGVYSNYQDWREVITDYTSLGKYLRDHGYYSAGAGKIYHYHMVDPSCWDEYWPSQKKNMPDEYLPNAPKEEKEVDGLSEGLSKTINMPAFENMYMMFDWASLDIDDATARICHGMSPRNTSTCSPWSPSSFPRYWMEIWTI